MQFPPVSLVNLTTGYHVRNNETAVVTSGISATLPAGKMTALLGPNGAGKSTLIKTLSGNLPPLEGKVEVSGKDNSDYTPAELAKQMSVVLTERFESTHLTVADLAGLGRSPYTGFFGRLSAADRAIVDESLNLVGISHLAHRTVATLSDGERQKAMIARALAQQTPVIFLDEPTAFLDYPGKVDMMMLLRRLCHQENKSVLLSTHDLELAMLLSDRLWLLNRADGLTAGIPEDLILAGRIEQYFSGRNLRFDHATASFKVDFDCREELTVAGDPTRAAMVTRSLAREGFAVKPSATDADITIKDEAYIFAGKSYASIEDLVEAVKAPR